MELHTYLEKVRTEELLRRAYRGLAYIWPTMILFEGATYRVNKNDLATRVLIVLILSFNVFRYLHVRLSKETPEKWQKTTYKFVLTSGSLWGALIARNLFLAREQPSIQSTAFMIGFVMINSSLYSFSISQTMFRLYMTPFLSAIAVAIVYTAPGLHEKLAAIFMFGLFYVFANAQRGVIERDWIKTQMQAIELQSLVDSFPGGIIVVSGGVATRVNTYFSSRASQSKEMRVPQDVLNLLLKNFQFATEFRSFLKESSRLKVEFQVILDLNGLKHSFWFLLTRTETKRDEIIVVGIDVEAKRQAEIQIKEQRAKLETSAKLAALGEMAGGIAHEVNNPIFVISSRVQLMLLKLQTNSALQKEWRPDLDAILATCDRIARIVRGLLTLTANTEGEPFQAVPVKSLIEHSVDLCEARVARTGAKIDVQMEDKNCVLEGKQVQLSQVMLNLLNNAFDAIEGSGSPWIRITAKCDENEVEITVTDSGSGIEPSIRENIMEPFFTTKPFGKGTGLGLSISSKIVKAHQGHLFLDPNTQNTRFVIKLPRNQARKTKHD